MIKYHSFKHGQLLFNNGKEIPVGVVNILQRGNTDPPSRNVDPEGD